VAWFRRQRAEQEQVDPNLILWRPEQYSGQRAVHVQATQLDNRGVSGAGERRRILQDWIDFLSGTETNIVELQFASRMPQELFDAATRQRHLRSLSVKWGPYSDLSALDRVPLLEQLHLGGATSVDTLRPLVALAALTDLSISQAYRVDDYTELSAMIGLRSLMYGNASLGSDRNLTIVDLEWVRPLTELRSLHLPGTRLISADLSPILDLPHLADLSIPLRRSYRGQVLAYAPSNPTFSTIASEYDALESSRATTPPPPTSANAR
jgi:hypothetical protein